MTPDRLRPPSLFEPPGSTLYHYTRLDTAMEKILLAGKLRMGLLSTMRDPRESQPWMPTVGGFGPQSEFELDDTRRFGALLNDFNSPLDGLRSRIKVLSLTLDDERVQDDAMNIYDWGFAHPRLWEHYADRHRGVCLCFDRVKFKAYIAEKLGGQGTLVDGPVVYENGDIPGSALFMDTADVRASDRPADKHVLRQQDELLFTKLADWETEMEYRFVLHTDHSNPVDVPFGNTLRAVIAGVDVSHVYDWSLQRLCHGQKAEFFRINWINGRPRLAPSAVEP